MKNKTIAIFNLIFFPVSCLLIFNAKYGYKLTSKTATFIKLYCRLLRNLFEVGRSNCIDDMILYKTRYIPSYAQFRCTHYKQREREREKHTDLHNLVTCTQHISKRVL